MSQDDNSGGKRKNPWGNNANNDGRPDQKGRQSPWGSNNQGGNRGGGGYNGGGNDFDDFLKNLQDGMRDVLPGNMNGKAITGLVALVFLILWGASGLYIINPGEHGVIQRFGAWSRTQTGEGLGYHLPAPIEQITKVNVTELKRLEVGFAENNYGRSNTEQTQRTDKPDESLMLTSDRNIVDLHMVIQWDIKSAEDYLFQIQNQENTLKKVAESAIREVVGQTDMFPVITTARDIIASKVKDIIQKNLDEYNSGVSIKQVLIQKAEVPPEVQSAFQDVQSAKQDAENTQNIAQAEREKMIPTARGQAIEIKQEAEGYKQTQIAKANGDAERFKSVYAAYQGGKDVTKERIYIETMEDVLGNAQKIILDDNGKQGVVPYLPLNELNASKPKSENSGSDTTQGLR